MQPVQIFPGNVPLAQLSSQVETQEQAEELVHTLVSLTHRDIIPFSGCLLTEVEVQEVLPAVPSLLEEASVKRGSLTVLDFGLHVFCQGADF